jgi:hypothetical protein
MPCTTALWWHCSAPCGFSNSVEGKWHIAPSLHGECLDSNWLVSIAMHQLVPIDTWSLLRPCILQIAPNLHATIPEPPYLHCPACCAPCAHQWVHQQHLPAGNVTRQPLIHNLLLFMRTVPGAAAATHKQTHSAMVDGKTGTIVLVGLTCTIPVNSQG